MELPESLLLHIFSFSPSFVFYGRCKTVLNYDNSSTMDYIKMYYFPDNTATNILSEKYLFLDYFLSHKHLLILDNNSNFEKYFRENRWLANIQKSAPPPNKKVISSSSRNIMRLSYFVECLRDLGRHQRQLSKDKIEQSNIGISYKYLVESILVESESQTKMLKYYLERNKITK